MKRGIVQKTILLFGCWDFKRACYSVANKLTQTYNELKENQRSIRE